MAAIVSEGERAFGIEELFFSTTDAKGIITSGNRVFQRVAAYTETEMIGQPHSLIRHPDEPRCVFKLLWDTIEDGRPIAAYVKNRAKTGEPYWVMATVVPCEGGYLSVRLKPSTPILDTVRAVYTELRQLELEQGGDREIGRKAAMAASAERLGEILAGIGFADYWSFMHAALTAELAHRAELMRAAHLASTWKRETFAAPGSPLGNIRAACTIVAGYLDGIFGESLQGYDELGRQLKDKSAFVHTLAEDINLFSLNALLAASRLGSDGVTLGTVAGLLGERSSAIGSVTGALTSGVEGAIGQLGEVGFRLSVAKLQAEMTTLFVDELAEAEADAHSDAGHGRPDAAPSDDSIQRERRFYDVRRLTDALAETLGTLFEAVHALDGRLSGLIEEVAGLQQNVDVMRALEVNGRIEAAHAADAGIVVSMFAEMRGQIERARTELEEFAAAAAGGRMTETERAASGIRGELTRLHANAEQLAA